MQNEETNGTSRGSPRGRYGVSTCRCATQPHGVVGRERARAADERARELARRPRDARAPARRGTTSESRKTTRSPVACVPARVARPAGEAPAARRDDAGAVRLARSPPSRRVDPSSTTITSGGAGSCAASAGEHAPSVRAAFRAGMTTL